RLPDQCCRTNKCAAEEHPPPARLFSTLQECENAQRQKERRENLGVGCERVARQVGVDKHGVSNATPCACPFVSYTRTNPPYDQGSGCDDNNGENVHRLEVVSACH